MCTQIRPSVTIGSHTNRTNYLPLSITNRNRTEEVLEENRLRKITGNAERIGRGYTNFHRSTDRYEDIQHYLDALERNRQEHTLAKTRNKPKRLLEPRL